MISTLSVQGYRRFDHFEMAGLERVNLLVGANNSGKSSVLEALLLLALRGSPESLWQIQQERGETLVEERLGTRDRLLDVAHLFYGHDLQLGSHFNLSCSDTQASSRTLSVVVDEYRSTDAVQLSFDEGEGLSPALALNIEGKPAPDFNVLPLTAKGGMMTPPMLYRRKMRRLDSQEIKRDLPVQFVSARSLEMRALLPMWSKIALTPDEERVLFALRILDPAIERIASQYEAEPGLLSSRYRGGFIVRMEGQEMPVPIGSLGEGAWRMLALAVAVSRCSGGVLLIDEIDTGLHYSVMPDLWKMILASARSFDVQVFATTHSYDCVRSLGLAFSAEESMKGHVSLQRIEAGSSRAVSYNEIELEVASENEIEVR